jgi:para-nitrobenzyl esterase
MQASALAALARSVLESARMRLLLKAGVVSWFGVMAACGGTSDEGAPTGQGGAGGGGGNAGAGGALACGQGLVARPGTVVTETGAATGREVGGAYAFLGLPFAAPPVGDLRFQAPAPATCWQGERDASAFGPRCLQWEGDAIVGDEDCLTLNVWTPTAYAEADRRPVLVFIHGGGHQAGGAAQTVGNGMHIYDGRNFAAASGAVVVTVNYRLGPFGFLAHPALAGEDEHGATGYYGTLDQIEALRWVQSNVARFGGDPARVLVFGESAGAVSVCRLVASPLAAGLFSAALMESGACVATPLAKAEEKGIEVAKAVGCEGEGAAACLRNVPATALAQTTPAEVDIAAVGRLSYDGVIDGWSLPAAPLELIAQGKHNRVPVAIGNNTAETGAAVPPIETEEQYRAAVAAFVTGAGSGQVLVDAVLAQYPASSYPTPRAAYVALTSDVKFVCTARTAARALAAAQPEPVFRFVFSHVAENASALLQARGAVHGSELTYVFGNLAVETATGVYTPGPSDLAVSEAFRSYWTAFARDGDPNGGGATPWPRYDAATDPYLLFADPLAAEAGHRSAQCDFWGALAP